MSVTPYTDRKYYQVVAPRSASERLLIRARDRIYRDFLRACRPGPNDAILDIGVSDIVTAGANAIERKYPYPHQITAAGLGEADDFRAAFPAVTYVQIEPNRPLSFGDKAFDIATSNAVLEHVGSRSDQLRFIAEMLRIARKVFITVPNRYFPVEHHTAIPLMHFSDFTFTAACDWLGKSEWADESNLILMSRHRLLDLVPAGGTAAVGYTGLSLGPFSSNLFLFVDDSAKCG
jgi:hypothetical protein